MHNILKQTLRVLNVVAIYGTAQRKLDNHTWIAG